MRNRDKNKAQSINTSNWQSVGTAGMMYGIGSKEPVVSFGKEKKETKEKKKKETREANLNDT